MKKITAIIMTLAFVLLSNIPLQAYASENEVKQYPENSPGYWYYTLNALVSDNVLFPISEAEDGEYGYEFVEYDMPDSVMLGRDSICFEVEEVVYQLTSDGLVQEAITAIDPDTGIKYAFLNDIMTGTRLAWRSGQGDVQDYVDPQARKLLNYHEAVNAVINFFGYKYGNTGEGGVTLKWSPDFGWIYDIGGSMWNSKDWSDSQRINAIINPVTGEIITCEYMPYSLW